MDQHDVFTQRPTLICLQSFRCLNTFMYNLYPYINPQLTSLWCCVFQVELQKDFDTVQSMLDEKEREMEALTKELLDSRSLPEGSDVSVSCFLFCFAFSLHFSTLHQKSKLLR